VLNCRSIAGTAGLSGLGAAGRAGSADIPVHQVGPRPGKEIDALLVGRVVVLGDDADLAAVALRLLRRESLGAVEVAYATRTATPVTRLWSLPVGQAAVTAAAVAPATAVPLVRDDVGGVLVGLGTLSPVMGTVYVDEHLVLSGPADGLEVRPDPVRGLSVTVNFPPRALGLRRGRTTTTAGRAVQTGTHARPTTVTSDGVEYRRPMDTWIFYKHTEPLLLVGATLPTR